MGKIAELERAISDLKVKRVELEKAITEERETIELYIQELENALTDLYGLAIQMPGVQREGWEAQAIERARALIERMEEE